MNNPFLSDRNIFSKVVNPIKKKEDVKKEDVKGQEVGKVGEKYKESKVESYTGYKNQKVSEGQHIVSVFQRPAQKMTFGVPSEPEKQTTYENKYNPKPNPIANPNLNHRRSYESNDSESQIQQSYNYLKNGVQRTYSGDNAKTPIQKYKPIQRQEVLSPPQEYKFQEYRKNNNLNNISPINPQVRGMADSEFLNIDALGDDLNRFLAESKNQDQLCKILGIDRTNKKQGRSEKPVVEEKTQYIDSIKDSKQYYEPGPAFASSQTPKIPAIFSKERKVDNAKTEQMADFKPQQSIKNSNDHVPTFNYMGLQLQNSTISNNEEDLNRFRANTPPSKQRPDPKQKEVDNLDVFNYSKIEAPKKTDSLQQQLAKEMMALSISGKYRTFLSSSQKVVTYRYKMQAL